MRIGIDGTPLTIPFHCGVKTYSEELIASLAKIDKKNKYVIFASHYVSIPKQSNFFFKRIPKVLPFFKRQLILPLVASQENLDIFHYHDVIGSIFFNFPKIITTIHDLAPNVAYPKLQESIKYTFMKKYMELTRASLLKKSSHFIVDSNSIYTELKKINTNSKQITIAHLGVNSKFRRLNQNQKKDSILTMTDFSPRKNIDCILQSYYLLPKEVKNENKLKIIISTSFPKNKIFKQVNSLKLKNFVEIIQNASPETLVALYNKAHCFLYSSLYEGFGLPILEAMACGCPVITSNYGAMKEVAGSAAYLVDPHSTLNIANAMKKTLTDLSFAKELQMKGLLRAKKFTWEETARKTLEVYNQLYNS